MNLPLLSNLAPNAKKPSVDAARARLGGRLVDVEPPPQGFAPGVVVTFALGSGRRVPTVIVFASKSEVHVLLDGVRLKRLPPSDLAFWDAAIDPPLTADLEKIAVDARLFGNLSEGQAVRYADGEGALVNGTIVEKCRWGALVLRPDGGIIAVGFRKLWPEPRGTLPPSIGVA